MEARTLLRAAVDYTKARGDDYHWFCEIYTKFREEHGVADSVNAAFLVLYGADFKLVDSTEQ